MLEVIPAGIECVGNGIAAFLNVVIWLVGGGGGGRKGLLKTLLPLLLLQLAPSPEAATPGPGAEMFECGKLFR